MYCRRFAAFFFETEMVVHRTTEVIPGIRLHIPQEAVQGFETHVRALYAITILVIKGAVEVIHCLTDIIVAEICKGCLRFQCFQSIAESSVLPGIVCMRKSFMENDAPTVIIIEKLYVLRIRTENGLECFQRRPPWDCLGTRRMYRSAAARATTSRSSLIESLISAVCLTCTAM